MKYKICILCCLNRFIYNSINRIYITITTYANFTRVFQCNNVITDTFLQLLLNLSCFAFVSAKCYKKERVYLHHAAICCNQSIVIIEHCPIFIHGAIA